MKYFGKVSKKFAIGFVALGITLGMTACNDMRNTLEYDRSADLSKSDYQRTLAEQPLPDLSFENDPNIPKPQPYVSTPSVLEEEMPLVSLAVNQTVPLRDILFEMTEQAGFDLEMDPQIQGSIIFTARNRPFDEVIDRISDMAGLRYQLEDGLLRVQLDRPYHVNYKVDYINIQRELTSDVSLDVSVTSGSEANVGSAATISTTATSEFWDELEENVEQILTSTDVFISMATLSDPQITTTIPTLPRQLDSEGNPLPPRRDPNAPPVLNVQFPTGSAEPPLENPPSAFSINRQSGMVSVFATRRQHNFVEEYLARLRSSVMAQVLIEAKILEVTLADEFAGGIEWGSVQGDGINFTGLGFASSTFPSPGIATQTTPGAGFAASIKPGNDLNLVASAISRFGTVRALSSPRLTVLNHQSAVLNVVENNVFFEFDVETQEDDVTGDTTFEIDSEIRSVPLGVVVSVIPSIDVETGEISLALRPTVTDLAGTQEDPTPRLALSSAGVVDPTLLAAVTNQIPELSVQEIDSIVKIQSGEIIVMGGLMREQNSVTQEGVPVLQDVPGVGNLFKNRTDNTIKTELVIFLKATLLPGSNVHEYDKELYKTFGQDRRPFRL